MTLARRLVEDDAITIREVLREAGIESRPEADASGWTIEISRRQVAEAVEAMEIAHQTAMPSQRPDIRRIRIDDGRADARPPEAAGGGQHPYRVTKRRYVPLDAPHHGGEHGAHVVLTREETHTIWGSRGFGILREDAERAACENAMALKWAADDADRPDIDD